MIAKNPLVYFDHILESIVLIQEYLLNCSKEQLSQNRMIYDAVLRNLQVLSESEKTCDKQLKTLYQLFLNIKN